MRKCKFCGIEKELEKFVLSEKYKGKQYYRHKCKECLNKTLRTGKPNTGRFKKGETPWLGRKHTDEAKRKISEVQKGKKQSPELIRKRMEARKKTAKSRQSERYQIWRNAVLTKDRHKCIKCDSTKNLHCDHIIPWKIDKNARFNISNGQTLCAGCHLKKGRENKEIDGTETQFRKGQIPWNKKVK